MNRPMRFCESASWPGGDARRGRRAIIPGHDSGNTASGCRRSGASSASDPVLWPLHARFSDTRKVTDTHMKKNETGATGRSAEPTSASGTHPRSGPMAHRVRGRALAPAAATPSAPSTPPAPSARPAPSAPPAAVTSAAAIATAAASPRQPRIQIRPTLAQFFGRGPVMAVLGILAIVALVAGMLQIMPNHAAPNAGPVSVNGFRWTAAEQQPNVRFDFGPYFTAFGDHELMLGTTVSATPSNTTATSNTTVWSSTDGSTWAQVSDAGAFGTTGGRFAALGMSDDGAGGIVVVGNDVAAHYGESGSITSSHQTVVATAWYSRDGHSWSQAQVQSGAGSQMLGVAARPGAVAAAGNSGAWFSADGRSWVQEVLPGLPASYSPQVIGSWNGGFVLVAGSAGSGAAMSRVWISQNGQSWTSAAASLPGFSARQIVGSGDRVTVVGSDITDPSSIAPASWSSTDGISWTKALAPAALPSVPINAVTQIDGTLVAVGDSTISHNLGGTPPPTPPLPTWASGSGTLWRSLPATAPALANARIAVLGGKLILAGAGAATGTLQVFVGVVVPAP